MATHPRGRLVLAIDQGTTSSRAIIFDAAGAPVAVSQKEHRQHFPAPAWVEHDAEEIWARVSECITAALAEARARPHDVAACGITNQRETVVVWDPATVRCRGVPLTGACICAVSRGPLCCWTAQTTLHRSRATRQSRARRSTMRSCGRTSAARRCATSLPRRAAATGTATKPVSSSCHSRRLVHVAVPCGGLAHGAPPCCLSLASVLTAPAASARNCALPPQTPR